MTAAERQRLPGRRRNVTVTVVPDPVDGRVQKSVHVTIGFFDDGRAGEIFINAGRPDSDCDRIAGDFGVLVSMLLQSGFSAENIAARLGRLGGGQPATMVGAALDLVIDEQLGDLRF